MILAGLQVLINNLQQTQDIAKFITFNCSKSKGYCTTNKFYKMNRTLLVFLFAFGIATVQAQNVSVKQMLVQLQNSKTDAAKITALNQLAAHYESISYLVTHPKAIDSAAIYAQNAMALSESSSSQEGVGQSSIILSKIAGHKKQLDKAKGYAQKAVAVYSKLNDKSKLALAHQELWNSGYLIYTNEENTEYAQKILKLYREAGDKIGEADALIDVADTYNDLGKLELARDALLESIAVSKSIGQRKIQRAYSFLCYTYYQLGDLKEAVRMAILCEKLLDEFRDESKDAIRMYNSFYYVYTAIQDVPKAHDYLSKAYKIALKYDDEEIRTSIECNMIKTLVALGRDKEALSFLDRLERKYKSGTLPVNRQHVFISRWIITYCNLKNYKMAARYVDKAIAMSEKLPPEDFVQNYFYPPLTTYYYGTEQFVLSRKYADLYAKLGERNKNTSSLMWAHKQLFKIDSIEKKFDSAIKHLHLHRKYNDSLLNQDKNRQIAELQVKYETDKKDKDLLLKDKDNKLLKKQSELQQSKIAQVNLSKNIYLGGAALLLIILVLLFYNYWLKQKSNRQLERQKYEIEQKNTSLSTLLNEKEWLLKEIHHRVKNNLQMVMSLLNTQSHYLKDDKAMAAIKNTQHRINSMALIHKKLYQSDNVVAIDMTNYIKELVEYLKQSFDVGQCITFTTDLDAIELDASQAIPLGLILNEAITNAIKYAFPEDRKGNINVLLKRESEKGFALTIKDDGVGIADDLISKDTSTLGFRLIKGLADDLDAKLHMENDHGVTVRIEFDYDEKMLFLKDISENKLTA